MYKAVFEGLVVDENDRPAEVVNLGGEPYYVVMDADFERHVPAAVVDLQVLEAMKEQVLSQRESVVDAMLQYLGQDDLFTKATVETSIDQMDENLEQLRQVGLPEEARSWLGMMGFRIVIDIHGEIVDLDLPGTIEEE
ncbi:MAG: hypothetical protein ACP5GX_01465 [Anaerolineae bacterium]